MFTVILPPPSQRKIQDEKYQIPQNGNFFYRGNIWFFRLFRLIGAFPFSVSKEDHIRFTWLSVPTFYTIFINIGELIYLCLSGSMVVYTILEKKMDFEDVVVYGRILSSGLIVIIPVISFLEARKMAPYLNDWAEFQVRLERLTQKKLIITSMRRFLCVIALNSTFYFSSFQSTKLSKFDSLFKRYQMDSHFNSVWMFVGFNLCLWTLTAYAFLWISLSYAICYSADHIIFSMENTDLDTRLVREYGHAWRHLREICVNYGNVMCYSYLYLCTLVFLISLPCLYNGVMNVMQGDYLLLIPVICTLFLISALADFSNYATDAVGDEFVSRLSRLLLSGKATHCEQALSQLIQTVQNSRPIVSLAGFLTMDRSINASLYSSVITYFIIIIQFRNGGSTSSKTTDIIMPNV